MLAEGVGVTRRRWQPPPEPLEALARATCRGARRARRCRAAPRRPARAGPRRAVAPVRQDAERHRRRALQEGGAPSARRITGGGWPAAAKQRRSVDGSKTQTTAVAICPGLTGRAARSCGRGSRRARRAPGRRRGARCGAGPSARGGEPAADHVAHHRPRGRHEREDVVPVAADVGARPAGEVARGEADARDLRQPVGQQRALERLRDLVRALVEAASARSPARCGRRRARAGAARRRRSGAGAGCRPPRLRSRGLRP